MSQLEQQAIYPGAELFLLKQFMRREGIDPLQALPGTGLEVAQLNRADSLVSSDQFDRLYRNLYRLAGRDDFGLVLGQALNLSRWGLLAMALQSSKTLGDALTTANRLRVLLRSRFTLSARMDGDYYDIEVRRREGMSYPLNPVFAHEMLLASLQEQIRQLLGGDFRFDAIRLNYPAPAQQGAYEPCFHCPVRFSRADSGFRIHRDTMHRALPLANPASKQQAMQVAEAELARVVQVQKGDILFQVRAQLQQAPALSLDEVAAQLALSGRTLRRRLQEQGHHFRALADEARLEQAMRLLDEPRQKVVAVAEACGFRDVASFRDAFRRWSGQTPQGYRRQ
ncbi:AraC family transcriptional regulator ligand-binding domain-containing protein [Thalassolituus sp. LLYu03]|uniref:AraC family transcriptional regulator n=1 Tax=Thalassolituus sp. LLYu03 TaxID=3421656 RepID=UPI003D2B72DA